MMELKTIEIKKWEQDKWVEKSDFLAVEEPLEIRLQYFENGIIQSKSVSITMRTPNFDKELAIGFLFTESILTDLSQVDKIEQINENQISVYVKEGVGLSLNKLDRNFYTTSSCGVCGKSSLDAIKTVPPSVFSSKTISISKDKILSLKDKINQRQSNFSQTGGIHASALFNLEGNLISIFEDVGRHNALDKLIGHHFLKGNTDLSQNILLLSGRASFELIQKAVAAKIQIVCAIGAPSSLAVDLAKEFNVTLIGFLKNESFNIYSSPLRII